MEVEIEVMDTYMEAETSYEAQCSPKENSLPICWTPDQARDFKVKNDWLVIKKGKLGCHPCRKIINVQIDKSVGSKIAKEWAFNQITHYGKTLAKQQTSLRKKIFGHKESLMHKVAMDYLTKNYKDVEVSIKEFRTAYRLAKENIKIATFPSDIKVQNLNGIELGETKDCRKILHHISAEMKSTLIKKIVDGFQKFSLIIDSQTLLAPMLSIYIKTIIPIPKKLTPIVFFLELLEVHPLNVVQNIIGTLKKYGMDQKYINLNLIGVLFDGRSKMGRKGDFSSALEEKFPNLILKYCPTHLLEGLAFESVKGGNPLLDIAKDIYWACQNNLVLDQKLRGINLGLNSGPILKLDKLTCRFRFTSNLWSNYGRIIHVFVEEKKKHPLEKIYGEIISKMTSHTFILDLALFCDSLQELSELDQELQIPDLNLYQADLKIKCLVQVLEERRGKPGGFYEKATKCCERLKFDDVPLWKDDKKPIDPISFYQELKLKLEDLINEKDIKFVEHTQVFDFSKWPKVVGPFYGEDSIKYLAGRLRFDGDVMVESFREYKQTKVFPDKLEILLKAIQTIPVSSEDCGRGATELNSILETNGLEISMETLSSLLFIRTAGPPFCKFSPGKYVDSWIMKRRQDTEMGLFQNRGSTELDGNLEIWTLL